MTVVDALEVVDVENHDGKRSAPRCLLGTQLQELRGPSAIEQSRELVSFSQFDVALQRLAQGNLLLAQPPTQFTQTSCQHRKYREHDAHLEEREQLLTGRIALWLPARHHGHDDAQQDQMASRDPPHLFRGEGDNGIDHGHAKHGQQHRAHRSGHGVAGDHRDARIDNLRLCHGWVLPRQAPAEVQGHVREQVDRK